MTEPVERDVPSPDDALSTRRETPGTRREPGANGHDPAAAGAFGTRREVASGDASGTRREATAAGDAGGAATRREGTSRFLSVNLPPGIAARFAVVEELPTQGADANVLLVDDPACGERRVLKLYRPGIKLDPQAVEVLLGMSADPAGDEHVVHLYEADREEGLWYEVQEHCGHGSLRTVLHGDATIDPHRLAAQLVPAVRYLHQRDIRHRDLKPENLLVRTLAPLDVVLADFGLARDMGAMSVRYTVGGTPAYQPPEAGRNLLTPAWDWWSLGMVVAEIALGRHPLADADGTLPPYQQIPNLVQSHPVDLSEIADERLRSLCRGLLVRDPDLRWRDTQALAWLAGEDPPVPDDVALVATTAGPAAPVTGPEAAPAGAVSFGGRDHTDVGELAKAFQTRWDHAIERLFQDRDPRWIEGLEAFLRQHGRGGAANTVARGASEASNIPAAMAFLLMEMDPDLEPVFDGLRLTPAGLEQAALAVLSGSADARRLQRVRTGKILTLWHSLPGMGEHAIRIDDPWQDGCGRIGQLVRDAHVRGAPPDQAVEERATARLLLALLDPQRTEQLRQELAAAQATPAARAGWWQPIAAEGAHSLPAAALAAVTAPFATRTALDEQLARDQAAAQARQAEAQAQQRADAAAAAASAPYTYGFFPALGKLPGVGWHQLILGAGALLVNLMLWWLHHGKAEDVLAFARKTDELEALRDVGQLVPQTFLVLLLFVAVQVVGLRMLGKYHRPFTLRLAIIGVQVVDLLTILFVALSGFVCVQLAAAGSVQNSPLADWTRSLTGFFALVLVGCLIAAGRSLKMLFQALLGFNVA
jgi:tRNA A-37 threonylcarbamoyl transferase component Bud32